MGVCPPLCPAPKSPVVQKNISNATRGTSLRLLQTLVCLSLADLLHHVKFEIAFCKVYTSTTTSCPTQGKVVKWPKNLCLWKKLDGVFLNYFFLAKINKWHLNPTGLMWCPKETQAFSLITLETSRGGLQVFSCHTFVTAVLLCRPKHIIPIGILPLCLFSSHLHPLKADINYFQWFTLQIKSKSAVCTGHS